MNYALDTPIKKPMWIPEDPKPVQLPPHTSNETQDHRRMTWLHHKPQKHAIFPVEPIFSRKK